MPTVAGLQTNIANTLAAIESREERVSEQTENLKVSKAELMMYRARLKSYQTQLRYELRKATP